MLLARARPPRGIGALARPTCAVTLTVPICPPRPKESSRPALLVVMISTHTRALLGAFDRINSVFMTWVAMSASGSRTAITILTPTPPLTVARLRPACRNSTMRGSCGVGRGMQFLLGYALRHGMLNYRRFERTALDFVLPELNEKLRPPHLLKNLQEPEFEF
jgi:hypothetical protein